MPPSLLRVASALPAIVLAASGCRSRQAEVVVPDPVPVSAVESAAPAPSGEPSAAPMATAEDRPASEDPAPPASPRTRYEDGPPSLPPFGADEAERAGWPKGWVPARVREKATVVIDGVKETWSLVWASLPEPQCFGLEDTCPCHDVADVESGELEL